jgi:hypothetical protein
MTAPQVLQEKLNTLLLPHRGLFAQQMKSAEKRIIIAGRGTGTCVGELCLAPHHLATSTLGGVSKNNHSLPRQIFEALFYNAAVIMCQSFPAVHLECAH